LLTAVLALGATNLMAVAVGVISGTVLLHR
jgi:hypothetical protein